MEHVIFLIVKIRDMAKVRLILLMSCLIPVCISAQNNEELYEKFHRYYEQGKTAKAEAVMEKIAHNNEQHFFELFEQADVFMKSGQLDSAYKYMTRATGFPSNNHMPESREYYSRRDTCYKWAIQVTEKMILKNDTVPGYYCDLGLLNKELGYRREAIVFFTKAIMLDSTRYIDFYNRALTYRELNVLDSAAADYSMSLKINPKNADTYLNRGFLYLKLEEYDKAIYDFERVPRYSADQTAIAYSLNNMGFAYYKLHKLDLAEEKINHAIRVLPSNSYAYRNLALVAIEREEMDAACQYLEKSKELGFALKYGSEVEELIQQYCGR